MKRSLLALAFLLFFSTAAFSDTGAEVSLGLASPNKGLLGARYSPMPWSFGLGFMLNSLLYDYYDVALAYSFHFTNRTGFYIFQSHHYLNPEAGNIWEIDTGGGYQLVWIKHLLGYVELGIPLYIGGFKVFRHYSRNKAGGYLYNRARNGDLALVEFRAGLGIGWWFDL